MGQRQGDKHQTNNHAKSAVQGSFIDRHECVSPVELSEYAKLIGFDSSSILIHQGLSEVRTLRIHTEACCRAWPHHQNLSSFHVFS